MSIRATSVTGGVRRALGVVALALLAAPLLWSAGACHKETLIMQSAPMPTSLMDLPTLMDFIESGSRQWATLDADCTVRIASLQIVTSNTPTGMAQVPQQVAFNRGRLQIERPGKIRLEAVKGNYRILLVGDGTAYRVDMAAFGDAYQGNYGDPLPTQPRRILLMPDDLVMGWDWTNLFVGKAPVLKTAQGGAEIDTLEMVDGPFPLKAVSSVAFDLRKREVASMATFDRKGTIRSQIIVREYSTVENSIKQPVKVPSSVWLAYPNTLTMIQVDLHNIVLNTKFPDGTFALKK